MCDNLLDMLEGGDLGREIIARIERRGEERAREEGVEALRSMIRSLCQDRFPSMDTEVIDSVTSMQRLRTIAGAVIRARSEDEARQALLID